MSWQENIRKAFSEREQEERRLAEQARSEQARQSDFVKQIRLEEAIKDQELQRASQVLRLTGARSLLEQVKRDVWQGRGVIREEQDRGGYRFLARVSLEFDYKGGYWVNFSDNGSHSRYETGQFRIQLSISSSDGTGLSVGDRKLFKKDKGGGFTIAGEYNVWVPWKPSFSQSIPVNHNNYGSTRVQLEEVLAECCRLSIVNKRLPSDIPRR